VTAIKNGKHDIRNGKPFPQVECLNNTVAPTSHVKLTNCQNANNLAVLSSAEAGLNDANGLNDCEIEKKGNGGILLAQFTKGDSNGISKFSTRIDDIPTSVTLLILGVGLYSLFLVSLTFT